MVFIPPGEYKPDRSNESVERRAAPLRHKYIYIRAKLATVICIVLCGAYTRWGLLEIVPMSRWSAARRL